MVTKEMVITNDKGLHARPASLFVQTASKYKSSINIDYKDRRYDAKSILAVLSAGITTGNSIKLNAEGEDAEKAISGLEELIRNNFGE